jgi:NitT/TauT family transport system ATP-binding protein
MKISVKEISFAYTKETLFEKLSAELNSEDNPLVILGSSGSGKTTFLKLLGGLLQPENGEIIFQESGNAEKAEQRTAFVFQEPRLLPWLNVLLNVSLPLEKLFGKEEARERAKYFLSLVSLEGKEDVYPKELSGGQAQRVSIARAFAWPAPVLLMDEPFQSLDIPLRINLMDLTLSLLEKEKRFLIAVTHDPREAAYIGKRIIVLEKSGKGIVFDKRVNLPIGERSYGSPAGVELEGEIIQALV